MRHIDRRKRFGQRADLVDLDQQGIGATGLDALFKTQRIGDEQIITHQLTAVAQNIGQGFPPLPVVFGHAVLNRNNRVMRHKTGQIGGVFSGRQDLALALHVVFAIVEIFSGSAIQRQIDFLARFIAGFFDGFHNEIKGVCG